MRKRDMRSRLKKIDKLYDDNYVFLERYQDNRAKQKPYVRIERRLQRECVQLQKDLDIILKDGCPLPKKALTCKNCTGRYVNVTMSKTTLTGRTSMNVVTKMVVTGGEECPIKQVARRCDASLQAEGRRMVG